MSSAKRRSCSACASSADHRHHRTRTGAFGINSGHYSAVGNWELEQWKMFAAMVQHGPHREWMASVHMVQSSAGYGTSNLLLSLGRSKTGTCRHSAYESNHLRWRYCEYVLSTKLVARLSPSFQWDADLAEHWRWLGLLMCEDWGNYIHVRDRPWMMVLLPQLTPRYFTSAKVPRAWHGTLVKLWIVI